MTKEYLSQKIETIEEALSLADHELKMLLDDEEVEKVRNYVIQREYLINELNKINLILLITDDNIEKVEAVFNIIRDSSSDDEVITNLMKKYSITKIQAETIINLSLNELSDTNNKEKRIVSLDELNLIEKELNDSQFYSSLGEKDIEFIIKSLEFNTALSKFLSYKSAY